MIKKPKLIPSEKTVKKNGRKAVHDLVNISFDSCEDLHCPEQYWECIFAQLRVSLRYLEGHIKKSRAQDKREAKKAKVKNVKTR